MLFTQPPFVDSMNKVEALQYLKENHRGVLATVKKDGRPQLSNIGYLYDTDGLVKISTTADRFKARNIQRDPQVSMVAQGPNWYEYIVVEGTATVGPEGQLAELRHLYEGIAGKPHPNWAEYDAAMLNDHRVIISITIEKIYPLDKE
ncbi:MAG: PPOX class F420-dependent oxidoreductase [Chloroflexi bacterium]|nr:PPOX class F420-dependent oxidoreductase [Chloroflexota bacterium]